MEIAVEVKDQAVKRLLSQIESRLKNLKPAMSLIGEIVHGSIQENFEKGGRPTKWKELSPITIWHRRLRKKWPGQILVRSGVAGGLMGGINYRPFDDRVELSANKVYATTHQFGALKGSFGTVEASVREHIRTIRQVFGKPIEPKQIKVKAHKRRMILPWGDIPARPFMMVQDEDWVEIKESLVDFLMGVRQHSVARRE